MTSRISAALGAVLLVLAVVLVVVGVLYLHDTAKTLPSFLPGHAHRGGYHETHKAIVAFVVAGVLMVGAGGVAIIGARGSRATPATR